MPDGPIGCFSRGNVGNIQNGTVGGTFGTPREYWQAAGDPSVAWDSRGNAYFSCQVFNRGAGTSPNPDASSGFLIFRSTQNDGASWDFPGRAVIINDDTAGAGNILEDKQYMTVDNSTSSQFRDRVYVTWTEFTETTAFIYHRSPPTTAIRSARRSWSRLRHLPPVCRANQQWRRLR